MGEHGIGDHFAIYFNDFISGPKTNRLRGATTQGSNNHESIVKNIELDTDTFEVSLEIFIRFNFFTSRYVCRVRIELSQNMVDRILNYRVSFAFIYIFVLHKR